MNIFPPQSTSKDWSSLHDARSLKHGRQFLSAVESIGQISERRNKAKGMDERQTTMIRCSGDCFRRRSALLCCDNIEHVMVLTAVTLGFRFGTRDGKLSVLQLARATFCYALRAYLGLSLPGFSPASLRLCPVCYTQVDTLGTHWLST